MTRQHRPLVLTADPELLDQLLGMAAAAGVAVDVAVEPATCHPQWTDAPLVLLGVDLAAAVTGAGLASRAGLVLVTRGTTTPELWGIADAVGAEEVVGLEGHEDDMLERLADVTEPPARGRVIGVLGGRGGAGASTLAAGLALTAARRRSLLACRPGSDRRWRGRRTRRRTLLGCAVERPRDTHGPAVAARPS